MNVEILDKPEKALVVRYSIVVGNVRDGFEFFGPFVDPDEAIEFCEDQHILSRIHAIVQMRGPL